MGGLTAAQINLGPSGLIQVKGVAGPTYGGTGQGSGTWAKGKILCGTGTDTTGLLAVGTNGWTIVADSTQTCGFKWAAPSSGLADPGSNGIVKRTALNTTSAATSADILGLWTGSCSSSTFLRGDGACATPSGSAQLHTITIPIAGAPIATGTGNVGTPSAPTTFSCTINSAKIVGGTSGSITVDIWKANGSVPSSGNKISASAPVTLSSAQVNTSSSLSGWTTSVSSNDIFWASVATADGVMTSATVQLGCQ